jgi:glutathione S-transferase
MMKLKLYFGPGACSFVPHSLLEIAQVEFEPQMVKLHKGEQYEQPFIQINPRSQVPVLVDGDTVITQILAIVLYLDTRFSEANFFPKEPKERAKAIELFAWMNNTVHPTFTHIFMPNKFTNNEAAQSEIKNFAKEQYRSHLVEIQRQVQTSQQLGYAWLTGANIGPLDVYAVTLMRWGTMAQIAPTEFPVLWDFVQRVSEVPGVKRAIERERLQLNLYKA